MHLLSIYWFVLEPHHKHEGVLETHPDWHSGYGSSLEKAFIWGLSFLILMHRRYSIALTKRRCLIRLLERRNRVSGDTFNFETNILLAKMRTMSPEEAAGVADQAVAEAEAAMAEAAEALRETEAAEADAVAATTFTAEAFKKRKTNTRRMIRYLPFPIYVNVKWLIFPSLIAFVVHLPYRSRAQLNLVRQFTS